MPPRCLCAPASRFRPQPDGPSVPAGAPHLIGSMRNANASTRVTMPTIFIPINNVGVRCPQ